MQTSVFEKTTKTEDWTLYDIARAFEEASPSEYFIKVPRFQRSLVWSDAQKRSLVDSLYQGFPIGVVLAYRSGEMRNRKAVLQVVDGLQRMSTIREYVNAPLTYVSPTAIFSEAFIMELAYILTGAKGDDAVTSAVNVLRIWLEATKKPTPNAGWNSVALVKAFVEAASATVEVGDMENQLNTLNSLIQDELTSAQEVIHHLATRAIPMTLYSGADANIPTIFERINNQGIRLSKYEILASSWVNSQTKIANVDIRAAVRSKYNSLIARGYEIDDYDDSVEIPETDFNLYEYLFGLGRVLVREYPRLFGDAGADDEVSAVAFVLLTVACKQKVSDMRKLVSAMPRSGKVIDPSALETAVFQSCKAIDHALRPFLSLKLNKVAPGPLIAHSQNQILSLICAYLANAFDTETWKPLNSKAAKDIVKNCPAHYLLDIVRNSWRGSGDSRLYAMTWQDEMPATHYAQPVAPHAMKEALASWHEELLSKKQTKRQNVPMSLRCVLLFLYADKVTVFDDQAVEFELEHIYPVDYLSKLIEKTGGEGWPISTLGNIMLLPKTLNQIKGKNLLGDFMPGELHSGQLTMDVADKIQTYLLVPDWQSVLDEPRISHADYLEFCRRRGDAIADSIVKVLKL